MMDTGCYLMNCMRYLSSSNPISVISATPTPLKDADISVTKIDRAINATLTFPNDIIGTLYGDMAMPWEYFPPRLTKLWVEVKCEGGSVELINFVLPMFWHTIRVYKKEGATTSQRVEKVYKFADAPAPGDETKVLNLGEDWWMTYRYQLEAFVDKIKGRTPQTWVSREDSVTNMEWIEKVYEKAGIGSRPQSEYVLPTE